MDAAPSTKLRMPATGVPKQAALVTEVELTSNSNKATEPICTVQQEGQDIEKAFTKQNVDNKTLPEKRSLTVIQGPNIEKKDSRWLRGGMLEARDTCHMGLSTIPLRKKTET